MWHSTIEIIGVIGVLGFGSVLAVYVAHLLTRDRERIHGIKSRRREFFNFTSEFKATFIAMIKNQLPNVWVPVFVQNAPQLKASFDQVADDLDETERTAWGDMVGKIIAIANLQNYEIYANQDKLLEALEKFPNAGANLKP